MRAQEKLLSNIGLFKVMDPEERSMLAGCMHPEQFLVDENIVTQGESGDTMYILAMGQAHVMKTFKPGENAQARPPS